MEVLKEHAKVLYHVLSKKLDQTPEVFHFDKFEIRDGKLYYRDKSKSLTTIRRKLRSFGGIKKKLGKEDLRDLGVDTPGGEITS